MIELLSGLPEESSVFTFFEPQLKGQWISVPAEALQNEGGARFSLEGARRWMALERYLPWWPRPVFGTDEAAPEAEYFVILWECLEGGYGVVLPLVDGNVRGVLRGGKDGWSVGLPANDPLPRQATVLLAATGDDPIALVAHAMERVAEHLGTFELRSRKVLPRWIDYFGWCTWDAFYLEVSAEKVLSGLASFRAGGISPRCVILDGGWQDERDERLWSFGGYPSRFPEGIREMVSQARSEYGVEIFGAWHTLQGYWNGVHPEGELASRYRLVNIESIAYNMANAVSQKRSLVHPEDARRFFDDYHRQLKAVGVNMVKVDNQASLDHFSTPDVPPTETMRAYQQALQGSVRDHFAGESLHCMSNSTDAVYALGSAAVWRSSQDFFPDKPETQGLHVFDNAFNAIWVQTFALPDWDMFQSSHPAAAFHAAARAISGGPIYVSDKPGKHDFALLAKLVISDGRILRSQHPALPARDGLFEDGRSQPRVTKIVNRNDVRGLDSPIGVLGLFNCYYGESGPQAVRGEYRASDVHGVAVDRFALYHHTSGTVVIAEPGDAFPVGLESMGFEIVTVSPMEKGVALFGLLDKFNGSRAMEYVCWRGEEELEIVLADGGRFGWSGENICLCAQFRSRSVEVQSRDNLFWVDIPAGEPAVLELRFAQARDGSADLAQTSRPPEFVRADV
jgi:raffinose synthase